MNRERPRRRSRSTEASRGEAESVAVGIRGGGPGRGDGEHMDAVRRPALAGGMHVRARAVDDHAPVVGVRPSGAQRAIRRRSARIRTEHHKIQVWAGDPQVLGRVVGTAGEHADRVAGGGLRITRLRRRTDRRVGLRRGVAAIGQDGGGEERHKQGKRGWHARTHHCEISLPSILDSAYCAERRRVSGAAPSDRIDSSAGRTARTVRSPQS